MCQGVVTQARQSGRNKQGRQINVITNIFRLIYVKIDNNSNIFIFSIQIGLGEAILYTDLVTTGLLLAEKWEKHRTVQRRKWSPDRKWSANWTANDPEPQMILTGERGMAWSLVSGFLF